jgi:hypothetical protein
MEPANQSQLHSKRNDDKGPSPIHAAHGQITIERNSPDDVQQRQIVVKLDGERVAELMYGQSVTREIVPGKHSLRVDNTWNWKTIEFVVAPGEHPRFRAISRAGRFTWFLIGTLGAGPMYVSLEREA